MRLRILAIGRLRNGPEKDLIEDYISRFDKLPTRQDRPSRKMFSVEQQKDVNT